MTDIQTGEPLPQANIFVAGSGRGGVTNAKGEYKIENITAGVYTVRVSLLGYQTIESKKVTINADETEVLNFKLAASDIQLEGVTVEGRPPIVDVKKTAGDQTFSREKIEQLPDVKGVEDILTLQAGVVKFGGQLFLRGGRANETQILIDGVAVSDASGAAAANQDLQQIYAGSASGGVLSVSAAAIQSVSVESMRGLVPRPAPAFPARCPGACAPRRAGVRSSRRRSPTATASRPTWSSSPAPTRSSRPTAS